MLFILLVLLGTLWMMFFSSYFYKVLLTLLTITKCPDCGRIMQKVIYGRGEGEEGQTIGYECRFCQERRIGPFHRGKKLTMYP